MKFREHRGGFEESMLTAVEVDGLDSLAKHLSPILGRPITQADLSVEQYSGLDERNGWDTHIVLLKGFGPCGFTDGQIANMSNEQRTPTADEALGMAWWNSLSDENRAKWAIKAGTGVAADAWAAFKATVQPCPKCFETTNIISELHPGTALAVCGTCGHRGPEVNPVPEQTALERTWAAWNAQQK